MSIELKVKAKSLDAESKIIRREEHKLIKSARWARKFKDSYETNIIRNTYESIYLHRICDVRKEARATHLARAYLKGMPYSKVEANRKPGREYEFYLILPRVVTMVNKYGKRSAKTKDLVVSWVNGK